MEYLAHIEKHILTITAVIIFCYTFITYLLLRATKKQTDLFYTPYILLRFSREDSCIFIHNVGEKIAAKICVEGQEILMTDMVKSLKFKFDTIEILQAGEEKKLKHHVYEDGKELGDDMYILFSDRVATKSSSPFTPKGKKSTNFKISFQNIFHQRYYYNVYIDEGEYKIRKFGRESKVHILSHKLYLISQKLFVQTLVWWKRRGFKSRRLGE